MNGVQLYQLLLNRPNRLGHLGAISYYTTEALAIAAGEASGVSYKVKPMWWGG